MRLALFSFDFPYPANRGGRADIWRRVLALRALGHEVLLVTWHDAWNAPTEEQIAYVRRHVQVLCLFTIRKTPWALARRLAYLMRYPSFVSARLLAGEDRHEIAATLIAFKPHLIWSEGPYPAAEASRAAELTGAPLIYRSHNIEHRYMPRQARAARRLQDRINWRLACIGLERFERSVVSRADWVFDISCDDLAYWRRQGVQHVSWLPPIAESALEAAPTESPSEDRPDVLFLGNLTTPNNVRGVEWLLREIRPRVVALRPGTRFVVAGSRPGPYIRSLCNADGVTLLADVPDALPLYRRARVLVNPVRTGSGTHMKSIEMLMMRAPIVTASQGTMGLPPEIKAMFRVADETEAFARAVVLALETPGDAWEERAAARRLFGVSGLADALAGIQDATRRTLEVDAHGPVPSN